VETKKNFTHISAAAQEKLIAYDWPGNVRELANVIERGIVLGDAPEFKIDQLPARVAAGSVQGNLSYHDAVNVYRRELIVRALEITRGNRAAAAKALGLHRTHLLKLIKVLRIENGP
jgi:two-component system response regulator AtoC